MADRQPVSVQEFDDKVILRYELLSYQSSLAPLDAFMGTILPGVLTPGIEKLLIPSYSKVRSAKIKTTAETALLVGSTLAAPAPQSIQIASPWRAVRFLEFAVNGFANIYQINKDNCELELSISNIRTVQYNNAVVHLSHNPANYVTSTIFSPNFVPNACRLYLDLIHEITLKY